MVSGEKTSGKKMKVVDRRWFNEDGELREPLRSRAGRAKENHRPAPAGGGTAAGSPPSGAAAPPRKAPEAGAPGPEAPTRVRRPSGAEFNVVVDLLAQQAAVFLTGAQGIEKNPAQARLFIDLLDILQDKTAGRLAPEEAAYLRDVLASLQLAFVESGP